MNEEDEIIACVYSDEMSLYRAFMPFIKNGGLFIRTKKHYPLKSTLKLSIKLLDEPEIYTIDGKVIWITPKGAQGNKPPGVGVQFLGEDSRNLSHKIETFLADMLKSSQTTDTI